MKEIDAFKLGFFEHLESGWCGGRTWDHDQDLNEAYDRGMNYAEELFGP